MVSQTNEIASPWAAMTAGDVERFGRDILDLAERKRWCSAILLGGLPYMWKNAAAPVRAKAMDKLNLLPGHRVLLLGEEVDGIGFDRDIRDRIGPSGELVIVDMRESVLAMVFAGKVPQWRYAFTTDFEDGCFDSIFVGQGVAHAEDWRREGGELIRTLRPGGSLVMAEISFGNTFLQRMNADMHLTYWVSKIMEGMQLNLSHFASHNIADVEHALYGLLDDLHAEEWRGCELLWGRKLR